MNVSQDGVPPLPRNASTETTLAAVLAALGGSAGDPVSAFGESLVVQPKPEGGWTFAYNQLHPELHLSTTTGAGALTFSNGKAVLSTGAAITSTCRVATRRALHYVPGVGGLARFTAVFPANGAVGSSRSVGVGDAGDGLFFGYRDLLGVNTFGIVRRVGGNETFAAQAVWSVDPMLNGTGPSGMTLNPATGNVYQIRFQWLGFGGLQFYVENPATGAFVLVHRIAFANANTDTSLRNPQLPLSAEVENTANATAVTLETPSGMLFTEGDTQRVLHVSWTASATRAGVVAEAAIVNLRSTALVNTVTSRVVNRLISLWASTSGGGAPGTVRIYRVVAVDGAPVWSAVPRAISMEMDTTGTFHAAGAVLLFEGRLANGTAVNVELTEEWLDLLPGEMLTITGQTTGGGQSWEVTLHGEESV